MSFSVALAVYNFARVEEVGHLLSPEVGSECSLRLRGREVSVEKHCASRALAQLLRAAVPRHASRGCRLFVRGAKNAPRGRYRPRFGARSPCSMY